MFKRKTVNNVANTINTINNEAEEKLKELWASLGDMDR